MRDELFVCWKSVSYTFASSDELWLLFVSLLWLCCVLDPVGVMEGGIAMPPMPLPPPTEDHPDMYISEEVKMFLPYFHHRFKEKVCGVLKLTI